MILLAVACATDFGQLQVDCGDGDLEACKSAHGVVARHVARLDRLHAPHARGPQLEALSVQLLALAEQTGQVGSLPSLGRLCKARPVPACAANHGPLPPPRSMDPPDHLPSRRTLRPPPTTVDSQTLQGTVVDARGNPVAGASVRLMAPGLDLELDPRPWNVPEVLATAPRAAVALQTDLDGRWQASVPAGSFSVVSWTDSTYGSRQGSGTVVLHGDGPRRLQVVDDGQVPVPGAWAWTEDGIVQADAQGWFWSPRGGRAMAWHGDRFGLEEAPVDVVQLDHPRIQCVLTRQDGTPHPSSKGPFWCDEASDALSPLSLQPLSLVSVSPEQVHLTELNVAYLDVRGWFRLTGEHGAVHHVQGFVARGLPAGTYTIEGERDDGTVLHGSVDLPHGFAEVSVDIDRTLPARPTRRVRLVDALGEPVAGGAVSVGDPYGRPRSLYTLAADFSGYVVVSSDMDGDVIATAETRGVPARPLADEILELPPDVLGRLPASSASLQGTWRGDRNTLEIDASSLDGRPWTPLELSPGVWLNPDSDPRFLVSVDDDTLATGDHRGFTQFYTRSPK